MKMTTGQRAEKTPLKRKTKWAPYLFIAPFLLSYFVFFIVPSLYSLCLSFFKYRGYGNAQFVGFSNYKAIFQYSYFYSTLKNVLFYYLVHTLPMLALSFLLAYLLHGRYARARRLFKALIFLPQVMAIVCASLIFRVIFATHSGVINTLFGTQIAFLEQSHPILMKLSVVVLIMWRGVGWYMVIFLSALTGLDSGVLESAVIDGAGPLQKLRYVVLPLMRPTLLLALVFETIGSLKLSVEPNMLLSGWVNAPEPGAPIINIVLNNMRGGSFGMASAAGWILTIIILAVTMVQMRMSGKED